MSAGCGVARGVGQGPRRCFRGGGLGWASCGSGGCWVLVFGVHACIEGACYALHDYSENGYSPCVEPPSRLSDAEIAEILAESDRRARAHRLSQSAELRALDANADAIRKLESQLDDARAYRAKLIGQALAAGLGRAHTADAAQITPRRLDAIRSALRSPG